METIFDDDVGDVGSEIGGFCAKCRSDTSHVIITRYEDEIRSVQCNVCGNVHMHRPTRGEQEEEIPEPIAAKRRQAIRKMNWDEAMKQLRSQPAMPYDVRATYREGTVLEHQKFGRGYVSEIIAETKMEATFKDGRRVLVFNRRDLPGAPKVRGKVPTPPPLPEPPPEQESATGQRRSTRRTPPPGTKSRPATPTPRAATPAPTPQVISQKAEVRLQGKTPPVTPPKASAPKRARAAPRRTVARTKKSKKR